MVPEFSLRQFSKENKSTEIKMSQSNVRRLISSQGTTDAY